MHMRGTASYSHDQCPNPPSPRHGDRRTSQWTSHKLSSETTHKTKSTQFCSSVREAWVWPAEPPTVPKPMCFHPNWSSWHPLRWICVFTSCQRTAKILNAKHMNFFPKFQLYSQDLPLMETTGLFKQPSICNCFLLHLINLTPGFLSRPLMVWQPWKVVVCVLCAVIPGSVQTANMFWVHQDASDSIWSSSLFRVKCNLFVHCVGQKKYWFDKFNNTRQKKYWFDKFNNTRLVHVWDLLAELDSCSCVLQHLNHCSSLLKQTLFALQKNKHNKNVLKWYSNAQLFRFISVLLPSGTKLNEKIHTGMCLCVNKSNVIIQKDWRWLCSAYSAHNTAWCSHQQTASPPQSRQQEYQWSEMYKHSFVN